MPRSLRAGGKRWRATGRDPLSRLRRDLAERDDLVALAIHESRSQLHTLSLQLSFARIAAGASDGEAMSSRLAKAQDTLSRYIERMSLLLDLTRLNAYAYPLEVRDFDLAALLGRIVDGLQADAQYHGVALNLSAPPRCAARTDASAIEHVVGNLVINALKHAACATVSVVLQSDGTRARIDVVDDGCGIPVEDQQRLLRKSERDGRSAGSGLGLWIGAKLTKALGGTLGLRSAPGAGSTFTLELALEHAGARS